MREVRFPHAGDRLAQQPKLELKPEREQLLGFLGRKRGDDGALMRRDGDEALGLELLQGFAQRDPADAHFLGDLLLADRLAGPEFARQDPLPQDLGGFGGDGAALDGAIHG